MIRKDSEKEPGIMSMDCNGKELNEISREDKKDSGIMSMDSINRELNEIVRKKDSFMELPLSEPTMKAIEDMGLKKMKMTKVQTTAIPHLLEGKDAMVAARTCPGRDLAFLIPAVELLYQAQFTPQKGIGVIFICPTPQMAAWMYLCARDLLKYHSLTPGLVCGYTSRSKEEQILKGVNLVVATPRRLFSHLQDTEGFVYENLKYLVIDEVDRMLELSFEEEMRKIISILPEKRQTIIFSTTQTTEVRDLAQFVLQKTHVSIQVDDGQKRTVAAAAAAAAKRRGTSTEEKGSKYRRKKLKVGKKSDTLSLINLYGWRIMKNKKFI